MHSIIVLRFHVFLVFLFNLYLLSISYISIQAVLKTDKLVCETYE